MDHLKFEKYHKQNEKDKVKNHRREFAIFLPTSSTNMNLYIRKKSLYKNKTHGFTSPSCSFYCPLKPYQMLEFHDQHHLHLHPLILHRNSIVRTRPMLLWKKIVKWKIPQLNLAKADIVDGENYCSCYIYVCFIKSL